MSEKVISKLKKIRDQFYSGKSALDENSQKDLFNEFSTEFKNFPSEAKNNESLNIWNEILTAILPSGLAPDLLTNIETENYFKAGNTLLNLYNSEVDNGLINKTVYAYLDIFRLSELLIRIYNEREWDELINQLIKKSNFTVDKLFNQRVNLHPNKTLFKVIQGNNAVDYSWAEVSEKVNHYGISLLNILKNENCTDCKITFLLENSLKMAQLDIACLTSGFINVMIPANSVPEHIYYILDQTKSPLIFLANEKQLAKIKSIKADLKYLKKAVLVQGSSAESCVISFGEFLNSYDEKLLDELEEKKDSIKTDSLATIMYTSGTTGEPKGIMFSQMNIVYKRFCRAMALPEISSKDRSLSYLPLFHTFGRWLEMVGSIFWGATYMFMENPSAETMIANMQNFKPTIFISIPQKWKQLYENITSLVDIELEEESVIKNTIDSITGGELRWGLSAAGYLDPEIFMFFQKYGIELMSGFGMTEATGGITMTPPENYIPNSLGRELPGIKIKLADDGELLIRGDYVMMGYFNQPDEETFTEDGWFPTGDIMIMDKNNFIEIIDRKKEIYKNIKGETIAPQKIENYFRDFEYVKQVFLVGDHLPFNTVLVYPNYEDEDNVINKMDDKQKQEYFSSVIVTVNKFLAPYERIIDFRIIDRPFSAKHKELTPKGTYKRRKIEQNFENIIRSMYEKNHTDIKVDGVEVRIPNWFLREKGCLSRDVSSEESKINIEKLNIDLTVKTINKEENLFKIGDYVYRINNRYIDLQTFLINPVYWVGNRGLFDFTGETIFQWYRQTSIDERISFYTTEIDRNIHKKVYEVLVKLKDAGEHSLYGLHLSMLLLQSSEEEKAIFSTRYIDNLFIDETLPIYSVTLRVIPYPQLTEFLSVRKNLFKILLRTSQKETFQNLLNQFLSKNYNLIDDEVTEEIIVFGKGDEYLIPVENILESYVNNFNEKHDLNESPIPSLFKLLAQFGIKHPVSYKQIRQTLVKYILSSKIISIRELAEEARIEMLEGSRKWLGENQKIAVDLETGEEYSWQDVITVEEDVQSEDKKRIIDAITNTSVIREAVFHFTSGTLIRLNTILPGGIWVSHLGTSHSKSVYRVSIQTRYQGSFDIALNLNKALPKDEISNEIYWLILAGSPVSGQILTEDFGGYWSDYDLWSEEFVPGDTVAKYLQRLTRRKDESSEERLYNLWPFFVWNATSAYYSFWKLTDYNMELADPSTMNINIPSHDYQTGTRLVSISDRKKSESLLSFIENLYANFIKATEDEFPFLTRDNIWNFVFSGIINAEGDEEGLKVLEKLEHQLSKSDIIIEGKNAKDQLNKFINNVKENGFIPKRLYFSIKRFHRWYELNEDAALDAQAKMLRELYETYNLQALEKEFSETRIKFFLETVFINSSDELKNALKELVKKLHDQEIDRENNPDLLSNIQAEFELNEKEQFFLTRLIYPHIKPTDTAQLLNVKQEGSQTANLVVQLEDYDGNPYYIRKPTSPKEISRLHQIYVESNLLVNFRQEHQFLVAISDRGYIIGGMYYQQVDKETAHMEKIVVSNRYRRKGISEGLMKELFNRAKSEGLNFITTGFFRPEYFYRFGFKIERKYSGLVKEL